jgi:uncharacterized membrane protein (DUF2068 family)
MSAMTAVQSTGDSMAEAKRARGAKLLRVIGVFKLAKSLLLVVAAIWAVKLSRDDVSDVALDWARRLEAAPGARFLRKGIDKLLSLNTRDLQVLAGVLYAYSAMFFVEGVGLVCAMHWAEWMVVITTSGLIPLEVYEMFRRPTALKAGAMVVNAAVVVYLVVRLRNERRDRKSIPNEN